MQLGLGFGLDFAGAPGSGGASGFTPLSLFTGGVTGVWLDPSDFSTMWQDIAGTTPVTAAGQTVGRMRDKSPTGLILTAPADDATRPTIQQDGSGNWYLQFTSANSTSLSNTGTFPIATAVMGIQFGGGVGFTGLLTNTTDQASDMDFAFSGNNVNSAWETNQAVGAGMADSTHFWSNRLQTAAITSGALRVISADATNAAANKQFPTGVTIGRDRNNAGRFYGGRVYQTVTTSTILSASARKQTEDYIAAKMGITLPTVDMDFANGVYSDTLASALTVTRASSGYAQNANGTLTSFGNNVARIGVGTGLLIEEARTNLVLQSLDISNASWTSTNNNFTTGNADVFNTTTAIGLAATASGGGGIFQTVTVANATVHAVSAIVKRGPSSSADWVAFDTVSGSTLRTWFNIQTGTVGTSGHTSASITPLVGGYYRIAVVLTTGSTTLQLFVSSRSANNSTAAIVGDGTTVQFFNSGIQIEAGAFATSYIPTTTVAVTRAADVVTTAGALQSTLAGAAGSVIVQSNYQGFTSGGRILSGGGSNDYYGTQNSSTQFAARLGLASLNTTNLPSGSFNSGVHKTGTGWDGSTLRSVVDNSAVTSQSGAVTPPATQYIGSQAGTFVSNMYVQRLTAWNTRISDTALKAATA